MAIDDTDATLDIGNVADDASIIKSGNVVEYGVDKRAESLIKLYSSVCEDSCRDCVSHICVAGRVCGAYDHFALHETPHPPIPSVASIAHIVGLERHGFLAICIAGCCSPPSPWSLCLSS